MTAIAVVCFDRLDLTARVDVPRVHRGEVSRRRAAAVRMSTPPIGFDLARGHHVRIGAKHPLLDVHRHEQLGELFDGDDDFLSRVVGNVGCFKHGGVIDAGGGANNTELAASHGPEDHLH